MCLAWTTAASLVERIASQGQQRYLAKHQLCPKMHCFVRCLSYLVNFDRSSASSHWLRQGRICCTSQMQSLQALQRVGCFASRSTVRSPDHCYPMSFRCLFRGSSHCSSSCGPFRSSCGSGADRDSGQRGDRGAEAGQIEAIYQLGKLWNLICQEDEASWPSKWGLELGIIFVNWSLKCDNVTDRVVGQSSQQIALWSFAPPKSCLAFCRSYPRHISTWNGVAC